MENTFLKLEIASMERLKHAAKNDSDKLNFIAECLDDGAPHALKARPENQREKLNKFLRDAAVPWWNPEKVWLGLAGAVKVIAP